MLTPPKLKIGMACMVYDIVVYLIALFYRSLAAETLRHDFVIVWLLGRKVLDVLGWRGRIDIVVEFFVECDGFWVAHEHGEHETGHLVFDRQKFQNSHEELSKALVLDSLLYLDLVKIQYVRSLILFVVKSEVGVTYGHFFSFDRFIR